MYCTVLILLGFSVAADAANFTYTPGPYGPKNWVKISQNCGGPRQSPINIETSKVVKKEGCTPLTFSPNYKTTATDIKFDMQNNGHTVNCLFTLPQNSKYIVESKTVPGKFQPFQFHFHWGSNSSEGSEHLVDGIAYPFAIHFIHYNTKYSNIKDALLETDGLLVLGTPFEITSEDNPTLAKLIPHLPKVVNTSDAKRPVNLSVSLDEFISKEMDFYYYNGSVTTPNCYEAVNWVFMRKPLGVSERQLNEFRKLKNTENPANILPISNNFRPPQPLNGRKVYRYTCSSTDTAKVNFLTAAGLSLLALLSVIHMA